MLTLIEVVIPDIGDAEATIGEISVAVGAQVTSDTTLLVLDSEKTAIEIPAQITGTVQSICVAVGDSVRMGTVCALINATAPGAKPEAKSLAHGVSEPEPSQALPTSANVVFDNKAPMAEIVTKVSSTLASELVQKQPPAAHLGSFSSPPPTAYASPEVYRYARQLGVDVARVHGSGRHQRILREDINAYVKKRLSACQEPSPSTKNRSRMPLEATDTTVHGGHETIEPQPLSRIKVIAGQVLTKSWQTIPHVTHHDEADITALEDFRKTARKQLAKSGIRLTLLAFITKALALTVKENPLFGVSLSADGQHLHEQSSLHIGIAVDTPEGLMVPTLRDVDQLRVRDIACHLATLSTKARHNRLNREETQGAVITISSLGGIGGTAFTPIINPPQVAILGISRGRTAPVWDPAECIFVPKLMLPLSLSYDHRVIDGAEAARFMVQLKNTLCAAVATLD